MGRQEGSQQGDRAGPGEGGSRKGGMLKMTLTKVTIAKQHTAAAKMYAVAKEIAVCHHC